MSLTSFRLKRTLLGYSRDYQPVEMTFLMVVFRRF